MELASLNADIKKKFTIDNAVDGVIVVNVEKNSDAAEKGLQRGDVIMAINQEPVKELSKAIEFLKKASDMKRKSALLLVSHNGETKFIAINLK